jgi:hypothetical protein
MKTSGTSTAPPRAPALQSPSLLPAKIHPQSTRYPSLLVLQQTNANLRIYPYSNREKTIIFQQPPATSFTQFLRSLPTHERWVVGHVFLQSPTEMHDFLEAVLIGDFGLGSDGSVKGLSTTYFSRIQSRSNLHTFINSHSKSEPTSTLRAEAYGYLGCLYLLRAAVTYLLSHGHNIAITSTNQYMDNLGVLTRLSFGQASSLKHHLKRKSDVIREIQSVQSSLQFPIRRHHVRSHQNDDDVDLSDLPFPTRVNKMCDTSYTLAHDCATCRPTSLSFHQSISSYRRQTSEQQNWHRASTQLPRPTTPTTYHRARQLGTSHFPTNSLANHPDLNAPLYKPSKAYCH